MPHHLVAVDVEGGITVLGGGVAKTLACSCGIDNDISHGESTDYDRGTKMPKTTEQQMATYRSLLSKAIADRPQARKNIMLAITNHLRTDEHTLHGDR